MAYSEKRAAQTAAFFISRAGGTIELLKLMKLMYLAERESLARYGEPITGDVLVSMKHGPVLSKTLDHINGFTDSEEGGWESWINAREGHQLGLQPAHDPTDELTQLSDADMEILDSIWDSFGQYSKYTLRDITHQICPEWEDPGDTSQLIPYSRVLNCVGYKPEVVRELEQRIQDEEELGNMFSLASGDRPNDFPDGNYSPIDQQWFS